MTRTRLDLRGHTCMGFMPICLGTLSHPMPLTEDAARLITPSLPPDPWWGPPIEAFDFCEAIEGGTTRLSSSLFNPIYQTYSGQSLPYIISSASTLLRFDHEIESWRLANPTQVGATETLARHIYNWVLSPSGLGVQPMEGGPELTADQAISQQRGDCTEFVKIYHALLTRTGFSPFPVWVGVDQNGGQVHHFATGVEIGGQRYLLDPVYSSFNAAHRSVTRISLRELLGWHWNNIGLDHQSRYQEATREIQQAITEELLAVSDEQRAEAETRRFEAEARQRSEQNSALTAFNRAQEIDPRNPFIYLNRGIVQASQGHASQAQNDFQEALRIDAQFHYAHYELGNLEFDAGRYAQAVAYYRQAIRLIPPGMSYPHYQRNLDLALSHSP